MRLAFVSVSGNHQGSGIQRRGFFLTVLQRSDVSVRWNHVEVTGASGTKVIVLPSETSPFRQGKVAPRHHKSPPSARPNRLAWLRFAVTSERQPLKVTTCVLAETMVSNCIPGWSYQNDHIYIHIYIHIYYIYIYIHIYIYIYIYIHIYYIYIYTYIHIYIYTYTYIYIYISGYTLLLDKPK